MARIHRWSVMIYGSLQPDFFQTKYNSHIHRYGTYIVVNVSKSIISNNQIFWRLKNVIRFDMSRVLLASKAGLSWFLLHSLHYQFLIIHSAMIQKDINVEYHHSKCNLWYISICFVLYIYLFRDPCTCYLYCGYALIYLKTNYVRWKKVN